MLKIKAVPKESIVNPSTNLLHNNTIPALITNKNKPNVKTVIGKVKKTKIGFKKVFSKPKTTATITAVVILSTCTPVKK
jgi:hypothetical protein